MFNFLAILLLQTTLQYPLGTVVRLTAEPESGWHFVEWEGLGPTNPLEVSASVELSPVFAQDEPLLTLVVNEAEGGRVGYEVLTLPGCGDGIVAPPWEACDDGGTVPGDGCSAVCGLEPTTPPLPPEPDPVPVPSLSLIDHGYTATSSPTIYRRTLTQPVEAGSTLVVLLAIGATGNPAILSVADTEGEYTRAAEAVSPNLTQWTTGRAAIFYRHGTAGGLPTITATAAAGVHVMMSVVELRGVVQVGPVSAANDSSPTPDPGSLTTVGPAIILAWTHTTGGRPPAGPGYSELITGSGKWYVAAQHQLVAAGTYETAFVGGAAVREWVAVAAAFR